MSVKKSMHQLQVGETLEPLEFIVTPELNQQYLYAEEDFSPQYIEGDEGGPIVHPSLLLNMSNATRSPSFYLEPGWAAVHASEETEFVKPARIGKKLKVIWRVIETYEKKGKPWQVKEYLITDEDGATIMRRKSYSTFSAKELVK